MKPYYDHAGIQIFHGDCREILPTLPKVDLVLTDPPYGVNQNTNNSRFSGGTAGNMAKRGKGIGSANGHAVVGDDKPFNPACLWNSADDFILWGWNNYPQHLKQGACLVWIKRNDAAFGSFLSDAEVAWMSKGCGVYCWKDLSNNAIANQRVHPTQKPQPLMTWCMGLFPAAQTILDPFMGSGTTLRAAKDLGRRAIGIEIEEKYCEIAARRMQQEVLLT